MRRAVAAATSMLDGVIDCAAIMRNVGLAATTARSIWSCSRQNRISALRTAAISVRLGMIRLASGKILTLATARSRASALSATGCVTNMRSCALFLRIRRATARFRRRRRPRPRRLPLSGGGKIHFTSLDAVLAQPVPVDLLLPIHRGDAEIWSHGVLPLLGLRSAHLCRKKPGRASHRAPTLPPPASGGRVGWGDFCNDLMSQACFQRLASTGDDDEQDHTPQSRARRSAGAPGRDGRARRGAERQAPLAHGDLVAEAPARPRHVGGARRRAHRRALGRPPRNHGFRRGRDRAGLRSARCGRLRRRRNGSYRCVLLAGQGAGRFVLHYGAVRAHAQRARRLDRRRRRPGAVGRDLCAVRSQAVHGGQYRRVHGRLVPPRDKKPRRRARPENPLARPRRRGLSPARRYSADDLARRNFGGAAIGRDRRRRIRRPRLRYRARASTASRHFITGPASTSRTAPANASSR